MSSVEELLQDAAPSISSAPDWQDVLRRSSPRGRRAGNRTIGIGVLVVILAVAAPAIALSTTMQRLVGLSDRGGLLVTQAHLILEAPAGDDIVVRLYSAPSNLGGECEFTHYAKVGAPVDPPPQPTGGGWCRIGGAHPSQAGESMRRAAIRLFVSVGQAPVGAALRPDSTGPHVLIGGAVLPDLYATSVRIEGPSLSERLHFNDNHFLLATDSIYKPSPDELPLNIVAYDAEGREVAREGIPAGLLDPAS